MRTLKQNTTTNRKAVLCSIMSAPQLMNELNENSRLYKSIEKLISNQRMLNLKNLK